MIKSSQAFSCFVAMLFVLTLASTTIQALPKKHTPEELYAPVRDNGVSFQPHSNRSDRNTVTNRNSYYPITVRGQSYFYRNGLYYKRHRDRYLVVNPPVGARVGYLPESAVSLSIGPHKYFRVGLTWYLRKDNDRYEVVEKPETPAETEAETTYEDQRADIVIYPASGQSAEQQDKDRYECYRWAKDQSGYDPTMSNQDLSRKDMYQRAMTACLEARDYTVR